MVETCVAYRDEAGHFRAPPGGTLMHLFSVPPHDCQVPVYEEETYAATEYCARRQARPVIYQVPMRRTMPKLNCTPVLRSSPVTRLFQERL